MNMNMNKAKLMLVIQSVERHCKELLGRHRKALYYLIPSLAFVAGWMLPSPFAHRQGPTADTDNELLALTDTTAMRMADGSVYDGSIVRGTKKRQGFGRLKTADGSVYEGEWTDDSLPFGKRTTTASVYTGKFDNRLNNEGFGIVTYTESYIKGKRRQGKADSDIVATYIGNWHNNAKQGIGRSVKVDGSMDFGQYANGILQRVAGANYRTGGSVYGIDLSHHQKDVDWDNLALYCDSNGTVYSTRPAEKKYMQPVMFVYMKATEGATVKDATYNDRALEADRHGVAKGAYHFLRMGSSVDDQVKNFTETANWQPGDMPPALDIEVDAEIAEYGKERLVAMALEWLRKVERVMHVRPIIYTREKIRNECLMGSEFGQYKFWIARYNDNGPDNFDWQLWQKTEKGVVNGYDGGGMDINLFKGDYSAFRKYTRADENASSR